MVINVGALKSGDVRLVERDIEAVAAPCRDAGALSKVIIEAALLTDDEKVTACLLAKAAGADFVKTSTGFGPGGATAADVALMRRTVGEEMGVKAAGGVRDLEGLKAMVAAGATRIGASAGIRIVRTHAGRAPVAPKGMKAGAGRMDGLRRRERVANLTTEHLRGCTSRPIARSAVAAGGEASLPNPELFCEDVEAAARARALLPVRGRRARLRGCRRRPAKPYRCVARIGGASKAKGT